MPLRPRTEKRIYSRRKGHGIRTIRPVISIGRTDFSAPSHRFFACVHFNVGGWRKGTYRGKPHEAPRLSGACTHARNPRLAVASALRKAARQIGRSSGAFRGA